MKQSMKESIKQFFKKLNETNVSKKYVIIVLGISMLMVCSYFSYAMFTVSKEKQNAIKIVTGNLTYKLTVNGTASTNIAVPAKTTSEYTVVLTNPNSRKARFNFYYIESTSIQKNINIGYIDGGAEPPAATGATYAAGQSVTYKIKVTNSSSGTINISLGVKVGLDYNDLELPTNIGSNQTAKIFSKFTQPKLGDTIVKNLGNNGAVDTTDTDETFITGTDPNNYVWYSGKLWRAMAINTSDSSVKLITQWAVTSLAYSGTLDSPVYGDSYIRSWLNDTSEDGFLGNLRNYNNFIETDSVWNATAILQSENTAKPPKTTLITDSVGLISSYEYAMTYKGATPETGYLNDGLNWWTISPMATSSGSSTDSRCNTVLESGKHGAFWNWAVYGVRPAVNLKSTVKIVDGDGSLDNPYRLENDNDVPESGTELSTRYSGEYVKFGSDSKSLYRIVSHEFGGTKIVSDVPIEELGNAPFDNSGGTDFSDSVVKSFLNINFASGYLTADQKNMVESATWYLGTVGSTDSYLNAKYSDPANSTLTTTVYNGNYGLLRYGELMSGQFDRGTNNSSYWTLTPLESGKVRTVDSTIATGGSANAPTDQLAIKPAMNLKSSVVIVSGDGTKNNPFIIDG